MSGVDGVSLERLEFDRVTAAVAERATCLAAARALAAARPISDPGERAGEVRRLDEALRRSREPGAWCEAGRGDPAARLEPGPTASTAPLDGPALVEILGWLEAARHAKRPGSTH